MKIEHIVVYTAVRIMDKALDTLNIPLNMLQLVALASFWISLKFHAVNHREVYIKLISSISMLVSMLEI